MPYRYEILSYLPKIRLEANYINKQLLKFIPMDIVNNILKFNVSINFDYCRQMLHRVLVSTLIYKTDESVKIVFHKRLMDINEPGNFHKSTIQINNKTGDRIISHTYAKYVNNKYVTYSIPWTEK